MTDNEDDTSEREQPQRPLDYHLDYLAWQIEMFERAARSYVRLEREVPPWLQETIARLKAESDRRLLDAAPDEPTPRKNHENISHLDQFRRRRQRGV